MQVHPLQDATWTHLWRSGSGTGRSWGCTPGFHQHTRTGRTPPRFHRRLPHIRHWAVHIRSHLEKGTQIKWNMRLVPDSSLFYQLCQGQERLLEMRRSSGSNQSPLTLLGKGSLWANCTIWPIWENHANVRQRSWIPRLVLRNSLGLWKHSTHPLTSSYAFPEFSA